MSLFGWIRDAVGLGRPETPVERLVNLILLSALKDEASRIVLEYRQDGDTSSWPLPRPAPRSSEYAPERLDAEFDDPSDDGEPDRDPRDRGALGVLYQPRAGSPYCGMRPPPVLWPVIRDALLSLADIDPESCRRRLLGVRYHGRGPETVSGGFALELGRRPQADFALSYEMHADAERLVIEVSDS